VATIRPFRALRPIPARAAAVSTPPYDVVSTEEASAYAAGNPNSFFHVSRPEIDLPDATDPHADAVHALGARALANFRAEGTLFEEEAPSLYLYRLTMGGHAQTGLVACCAVDDYDADRIKKHEKTRPDKEDDRTRHLLALSAHDEPVFLTCAPHPGFAERAADAARAEPLYDFTAPDGVRHALWRIDETQPWVEAFAAIAALYVADGHHRTAAASRARAELRARAAGGARAWTGEEQANFFPAVIFPADEVRILPYNRVIRDAGALTPDALVAAAGARFEVSADAPPTPERKGRISMYARGKWWGLAPRAGTFDPRDPVASLDVQVLQDNLLAKVIGIADPRTDPRIDFVGGIRGTAELEKRAGAHGAAFSMFPVSVGELMAIADAGKLLPPKSTWFEPKLRSGLFVHLF
jgi:uncharacterized protein (DUF1015 family)